MVLTQAPGGFEEPPPCIDPMATQSLIQRRGWLEQGLEPDSARFLGEVIQSNFDLVRDAPLSLHLSLATARGHGCFP